MSRAADRPVMPGSAAMTLPSSQKARPPSPVIRPLTCNFWERGQDLNLRPLGYEDREARFNPVRTATGTHCEGNSNRLRCSHEQAHSDPVRFDVPLQKGWPRSSQQTPACPCHRPRTGSSMKPSGPASIPGSRSGLAPPADGQASRAVLTYGKSSARSDPPAPRSPIWPKTTCSPSSPTTPAPPFASSVSPPGTGRPTPTRSTRKSPPPAPPKTPPRTRGDANASYWPGSAREPPDTAG